VLDWIFFASSREISGIRQGGEFLTQDAAQKFRGKHCLIQGFLTGLFPLVLLQGSRFDHQDVYNLLKERFDKHTKRAFEGTDGVSNVLFGTPFDNDPEHNIHRGNLALSWCVGKPRVPSKLTSHQRSNEEAVRANNCEGGRGDSSNHQIVQED
jgi:hypothetical protein